MQNTKLQPTLDAAPLLAPLRRIHMPSDYQISLDLYIGRPAIGGGYLPNEVRIPTQLGPEQPMQGFESTYKNIIDYIVRITYRIWEDRDVAYIGDTYSEDSHVYDDYGLQLGNQKIIADTHHTTGAFSNIRLIADEVIWAGDDQVGYRTSHRTIIRGTNDGDSKYGPATGRDVDVLVIANCVALGNKIFLEHVLYNNSSLLLQLGLDLSDEARKMTNTPPQGWPRSADTWLDLKQATRPKLPISVSEPVQGFDVDAFVRRNVNAIWNHTDPDVLKTSYYQDLVFQGPTDRAFTGIAAYQCFIHSLRTPFPDLDVNVDEVYWMGNQKDGYITSVRWSADATHTGQGGYGPPTGKRVQIWGISQHRIVGERISHEWTLFNELDLLMQIHSNQ